MGMDVRVNLIECFDDAAEMMRWLGERREVLAFDTETEGLHFWRQKCRLAQFGDSQTGWAIPFERWSGVVEEVFRRYQGPITGHNLRFDARFMDHHGIDIGLHRCHDTMLACNALWPDQRMGLKEVAVKRLNSHAADGEARLHEDMAKGGWTWATVPIDLPSYWAYGALDAIWSAQIHEQVQPMLDAEGVRGVYELECAVSDVLFKMETRGAYIDIAFCEQKYSELMDYAEELRNWCSKHYGISPGSPGEVALRLQHEGVQLMKRTRGGKPALDEDVLSRLDHPLAQAVLSYRRAVKIASTYFYNFLKLQDNGVLHCSVRQVGARTGRMSITEPALQTLPRDANLVRSAFVPSDGNKLVSIDYEQIEMRIFAHFSGETEMIKRIKSGVNMHTAVAQVIFGIEDVPTHLYQITKNANFAKVFCAGAKKFAQTAGITEEEAVNFYANYEQTFPGVREFQKNVLNVAQQRYREEGRAYVRAPSGRLHVADQDTAYKLVNYLIQGTAADVLKQKIVALDACGFGEYMVLPVHDEIIFSFKADEAIELTQEARAVMEDHESFTVPLTVDASPPMDRWEK